MLTKHQMKPHWFQFHVVMDHTGSCWKKFRLHVECPERKKHSLSYEAFCVRTRGLVISSCLLTSILQSKRSKTELGSVTSSLTTVDWFLRQSRDVSPQHKGPFFNVDIYIYRRIQVSWGNGKGSPSLLILILRIFHPMYTGLKTSLNHCTLHFVFCLEGRAGRRWWSQPAESDQLRGQRTTHLQRQRKVHILHQLFSSTITPPWPQLLQACLSQILYASHYLHLDPGI